MLETFLKNMIKCVYNTKVRVVRLAHGELVGISQLLSIRYDILEKFPEHYPKILYEI